MNINFIMGKRVQRANQGFNWLENRGAHHQKSPFLADLEQVSFFAFPICASPILGLLPLWVRLSLSPDETGYYILYRKNPTSALRQESFKLLPFSQMWSPARGSWVLSGRDEGQQAGLLLLFGCHSGWETGICACLVSKLASYCEETPNSSANSFFPTIGRACQTLKLC